MACVFFVFTWLTIEPIVRVYQTVRTSNANPQNEFEPHNNEFDPLDGFFSHVVALGAPLGAVVNCIGALGAVRAGLENITPEDQSNGPYVKYNSS